MDKKTILIVEDEDKLRMTVADFLKIYDYEIWRMCNKSF